MPLGFWFQGRGAGGDCCADRQTVAPLTKTKKRDQRVWRALTNVICEYSNASFNRRLKFTDSLNHYFTCNSWGKLFTAASLGCPTSRWFSARRGIPQI